ncbi:hypothetical protein [Rhizobium sp. NFR07]|uniref:hypothetical protein n=1 Tax=Rhizobium sp. NFR07 TaxID=1566262 RepID=UPI0011602B29|nr:hypothetical protein [Rhizobium sp. NFR07]
MKMTPGGVGRCGSRMGVVPSLIGQKSDWGVEGSRLAASPSERAFGANPMIYLPYLYEMKFWTKLSEAPRRKPPELDE